MPQNQVIDLNDFSVSKFNQLVHKITNIGHQLHSNGLNMTSFVCLKLILLLNPGKSNIIYNYVIITGSVYYCI